MVSMLITVPQGVRARFSHSCSQHYCALFGAGLVQAIFTISVLTMFIPVYYSFYLSFLWQVGTSIVSPYH